MPLTVTASNNTVYHLWQLPDLSSPEPEIGIAFTTLDNDLSDGYRSTRLFGSNTGVRKWRLNLPTLAGSDIGMPTVTDINGATVSREEYIWSLYTENKVTGTPFAYTDPRSGQYYLVDFEEDELSYQRMRVKLYSTGLTLRQRRLSGVTIFAVTRGRGANAAIFNEYETFGPAWISASLGTDLQEFSITGNVDDTGTQNGLRTAQFNVGATDTGFLLSDSDIGVCEAFFVMKMREATFSNNAGIFTAQTATAILAGNTGTTKFYDLGLSDFEYSLNNVVYDQADMQAPMNTFGIVHIRKTDGSPFFTGLMQVGKDRDFAGRFAEMDMAEMIFFNALQPLDYRRELIQHLTIKWNII